MHVAADSGSAGRFRFSWQIPGEAEERKARLVRTWGSTVRRARKRSMWVAWEGTPTLGLVGRESRGLHDEGWRTVCTRWRWIFQRRVRARLVCSGRTAASGAERQSSWRSCAFGAPGFRTCFLLIQPSAQTVSCHATNDLGRVGWRARCVQTFQCIALCDACLTWTCCIAGSWLVQTAVRGRLVKRRGCASVLCLCL